jgi:hypothetical protein
MPLKFIYVQWAFYIAVFSWVYVHILTDEGMILSWWYKLLSRINNPYILKPILTCEYCVAGQIALWGYFFLGNYNFIQHIIFISLTILLVHIINGIKTY